MWLCPSCEMLFSNSHFQKGNFHSNVHVAHFLIHISHALALLDPTCRQQLCISRLVVPSFIELLSHWHWFRLHAPYCGDKPSTRCGNETILCTISPPNYIFHLHSIRMEGGLSSHARPSRQSANDRAQSLITLTASNRCPDCLWTWKKTWKVLKCWKSQSKL